MSERTMLQGMLAEKRLKLKELITRADALVVNIHMQCSPRLDVDKLAFDQIASQAKDLEHLGYQIRKLQNDVEDLKKDLGMETDD